MTDWLIDIVSLGEIGCTQCQYNFMHASSTACQHLGSSEWISPKVRFPFSLNIRSSVHSFIVRRACCEFNSQYDSFTVVLLDIRSDTWVIGLAPSKKAPKKCKKWKIQAEEKRSTLPSLLGPMAGFPKKRLDPLCRWLFKMVLAPCCLWETPEHLLL